MKYCSKCGSGVELRIPDLDYAPGYESLDVRLLTESDVPWFEIAFLVVEETLKRCFQDHGNGELRLHTGDAVRVGGGIQHQRISTY